MKKLTEEQLEEMASVASKLASDEEFAEKWHGITFLTDEQKYHYWIETLKEDKLSEDVLYSIIALLLISLDDYEASDWYEDLLEKAKEKVSKK